MPTSVIAAAPLPMDTSEQKAELIVLWKALELAAGGIVNMWTDSKYAFSVVHAHGTTINSTRISD